MSPIEWSGRKLASGPSGGYVYVFSDDGTDLNSAKSIYIKCELPGRLILHGRGAKPKSVMLVDISPLGNRNLEDLRWSMGTSGVEIAVAPTQQAYWVQVEG
jgi:hypothetical protein